MKGFVQPANQITRKTDESKNGEQKKQPQQIASKDTSQKSEMSQKSAATDGSQAKSPTLMMKADSNSSIPRNGSSTGLFMLPGGAFGRVPSYPMLSTLGSDF